MTAVTTEPARYAFVNSIDRGAEPVSETMRFAGVVAPWSSPSHRLNDWNGEREVFAPGSVVPYADTIPLTRQHSYDAFPIGKSLRAENREDGLWMEFQLAPTREGKEAALLIDGDYVHGLSVEMMNGIQSRTETIDDERMHIVEHCRIQGVGLVGVAAYPEAKIVDMRSLSRVIVPNASPPSYRHRDELESWIKTRVAE